MTFRPYTEIKSSGVEDTRPNNTGVQLNKATPVRINTNGELDFVNVSIEDEAVNVAGLTSEDIGDGSNGNFVSTGKITNISTSANFGDVLYVSKSGGLTNTKPSLGVESFVSGDFVISVGVVAKNQNNPSNKDLVLNIDVVGQL